MCVVKENRIRIFLILFQVFILGPISLPAYKGQSDQKIRSSPEAETTLLRILGIIPSPESIEYVQEKTSCHVHTLVTEQRHPKTWNLSERIEQDLEAGLRMLWTADDDILAKLRSMDRESPVLERAVQAIEGAIRSGNKIYLFGCRDTGRWMKWVESSIWRPFWRAVQAEKKIWAKLGPKVGEGIENRLIGEMPGADRALISPLSGWDDLMLTGRLQLEERGIEPGDVIFCVSASGESPAVIGTIYEALDQWTRRYPYDAEKIQKKLFFIFNNPEADLLSFDRSQAVMEEPGISKINLTTGPQALMGSNRMQASTIDAFLLAHILQTAIDRTLRQFLSDKEMVRLGFETPVVFTEKMEEFSTGLKEAKKTTPGIAKLVLSTENAFQEKAHTSFLALKALGTVFNECAERGPAFNLWPLDTVKTPARRSHFQVWTPEANQEEAWIGLLSRPFRGLEPSSYRTRFEKEIKAPDPLQVLLRGLENAGDDQQYLYDFSFSDFNLRNRGAAKGDLGVLVMIGPEEKELKNKESYFARFLDDHLKKGAKTALILFTEKSEKETKKILRKYREFNPDGKDILLTVPIGATEDPLSINQLTALKIILNAHSTAVMARSGRVIGNTLATFDPGDLRSVDRATAMLLSHVNDVLKRPGWVKQNGILKPISYGEANAVLFDSLPFMKNREEGPDRFSDIGLCIVRVLESLRQKKAVSPEEASLILQDRGLPQYLKDVTTQID